MNANRMAREAISPIRLAPGPDPLARELAKQITSLVGRLAAELPLARGVRDPRQDALWDCAAVLQRTGAAAESPGLVEQLERLARILDAPEATDLADRLSSWAIEAGRLVDGPNHR